MHTTLVDDMGIGAVGAFDIQEICRPQGSGGALGRLSNILGSNSQAVPESLDFLALVMYSDTLNERRVLVRSLVGKIKQERSPVNK